MTKVLLVASCHQQQEKTGQITGCSLAELSQAYQWLSDVDIDVELTTPTGQGVVADPLSPFADHYHLSVLPSRLLSALHGLAPLKTHHPEDYDAVFFVGGVGALYSFPNNPDVQAFVQRMLQANKIVVASGFGVSALVGLKQRDKHYVSGKIVSCYTNEEAAIYAESGLTPFMLESKLMECGAQIVKAPMQHKKIVISDNLITAQNAHSVAAVSRALIQKLHASVPVA